MKPVDLIVANAVHEAAILIRRSTDDDLKKLSDPAQREEIVRHNMRHLLNNLAYEAPMPAVMRALAAMGAPATPHDLWERIAAAGECQREQERAL